MAKFKKKIQEIWSNITPEKENAGWRLFFYSVIRLFLIALAAQARVQARFFRLW
jgi:hypothetical protein